MNLRARLEPAGRVLLELLDPGPALSPTQGYEVAHDLGRWWDAALRLEEATGFVIPPAHEAAAWRNLQQLTNNPDRLLMVDRINPHNFRESLLAYGGLVRHRDSAWARAAGLQLVQTMDRCLLPDGSFDFTRLASWGRVPHTEDPSHTETKRNGWFDGTATSGRSLEALVWFYEATQEPLVLAVARRIAGHHLTASTSPDGSLRPEITDPANVGHNHSFHGTLRGLLRYGLLTGQQNYLDVVYATYTHPDHARIVMESGWAPHDLGQIRFPNPFGDGVGEPATTGDAAQLALWLALEAGHCELLDDVERLVRARILPVQMNGEDIRNNPQRTFKPRELGAWGVNDNAHAGKGCIPDVHAAVIHTLCDIQRHICTHTETGVRVNLHFDYEDSLVRVTSRRNGGNSVTVRLGQPANLLVRVPAWATPQSVAVTVDGGKIGFSRQGAFAFVPRELLGANSEVVLTHDLPRKRTEEHMTSGRSYRFQWRGDEILGVSPQEGPLPFYPPLAE